MEQQQIFWFQNAHKKLIINKLDAIYNFVKKNKNFNNLEQMQKSDKFLKFENLQKTKKSINSENKKIFGINSKFSLPKNNPKKKKINSFSVFLNKKPILSNLKLSQEILFSLRKSKKSLNSESSRKSQRLKKNFLNKKKQSVKSIKNLKNSKDENSPHSKTKKLKNFKFGRETVDLKKFKDIFKILQEKEDLLMNVN